MRNFENWLSTFTDNICDYHYYVDFDKVYKDVKSVEIELNILNSLIGSKNIREKFFQVVSQYPKVLSCIPLLLAVREKEIHAEDKDGAFNYNFDKMNYAPEQYAVFMEKTGLFDLLSNHLVSNLVDYAIGVETGLESNARKNRGGSLMETLVANGLAEAGFKENIDFFKQMTTKTIEKKFGLDLSPVSDKGKAKKKFDFVVKTGRAVYGVETNFYKGGGSKLNETARSYKHIALEARNIPGFVFVWFTDGQGWNKARNNLRETFEILETLYNIADIKNGVMKQIFK